MSNIEQLEVDPSKYSRPIRIYGDVDGVISPYFHSREEAEAHKPQRSFMFERWSPSVQDYEGARYDFQWDEFAVNKYREWSLNPNVDFVWLTSLRHNAPKFLDPFAGIESIGYLPWTDKLGDHDQSFKKVAVEEDQESHPSKFVWIDDMANIASYGEALFVNWDTEREVDGVYVYDEIIKSTEYLAITPNKYVGLTPEHAAQVDAFIARNS